MDSPLTVIMTRVNHLNINGKFAVTVDNVFTAEECQALIDLSEASGNYKRALVNTGFGQQTYMKDVRNNDRWIHDNVIMAADFFSKVSSFIPATFDNMPVSCLNERLRFLRYDPKQYFKPHHDGEYTRDDNSETSRVTVQIYLNDNKLIGGETTFIGMRKNTAVYPKTGRVLLFQHDILHEGSPVISGRKYVIRTDVMYLMPGDPHR